MTVWPARRGLRASVTLVFALGALALSASLSLGTYFSARHLLVEQRERTALRQAFTDAALVRDSLLTSGSEVSEVLGSIAPPTGAVMYLHRDDTWYSSSIDQPGQGVTDAVARTVEAGSVGLAWSDLTDPHAVVVGVPLPAVDAAYYEVSVAEELAATLRTLALALAVCAALTTVGGALLGRAASRRVLQPLGEVAGAAVQVSAGDLETRLRDTSDPDLAVLVGAFNHMVDALHERIERDARFAADVSHELRTPLTTLTTSLGVLQDVPGLSPGASSAVQLMATELTRFRRALEDLLALGRLDAGAGEGDVASVGARELVRQALRRAVGRRTSCRPGAGTIHSSTWTVARCCGRWSTCSRTPTCTATGSRRSGGDRRRPRRVPGPRPGPRRSGAGSRADLRALRARGRCPGRDRQRPGPEHRGADRDQPRRVRVVLLGRRPGRGVRAAPAARSRRDGGEMSVPPGAAAVGAACSSSRDVACRGTRRCGPSTPTSVPYNLLDPEAQSRPGLTGPVPVGTPVVFWLVHDDRLAPTAVAASCTDPVDDVVDRLLGLLAAAPDEAARSAGRSSAIPSSSELDLVEVADGVALVEFDPATSLTADRLPLAMGQLVLTVTSAPGIEAVRVSAAGDTVEVPLPGGALTDRPVTADDYATFLPERFLGTGRRGLSTDIGCPTPDVGSS